MKKYRFLTIFAIVFFSYCSGTGTERIKAPGIVEGDIISLKSRVSAKLENLLFEEGNSVTKGDVIARLDSRLIVNRKLDLKLKLKELGLNISKMKKRVIQINANRNYLKKQTEKMERLSRKKSVSKDAFEKIKLKLLEAETSYYEMLKSIESLELQKSIVENKKDSLDIMFEDYSVYTPVSGYILEEFVSQGENVFPGMAIADILDVNSLYIEIFLEERELSGIVIGQKAKIVVDGLEGRNLSGVISFIGKKAEFSPKYVISEKERKALLFKVKIALRDNLDIYKTGMPVTVVLGRRGK